MLLKTGLLSSFSCYVSGNGNVNVSEDVNESENVNANGNVHALESPVEMSFFATIITQLIRNFVWQSGIEFSKINFSHRLISYMVF